MCTLAFTLLDHALDEELCKGLFYNIFAPFQISIELLYHFDLFWNHFTPACMVIDDVTYYVMNRILTELYKLEIFLCFFYTLIWRKNS